MTRRTAPFADAPTNDLWLTHSVPAPPGCADLALGLALRCRDRQRSAEAAGTVAWPRPPVVRPARRRYDCGPIRRSPA